MSTCKNKVMLYPLHLYKWIETWNFFRQKFEIYPHASGVVSQTAEQKGYLLPNYVGDAVCSYQKYNLWEAQILYKVHESNRNF